MLNQVEHEVKSSGFIHLCKEKFRFFDLFFFTFQRKKSVWF